MQNLFSRSLGYIKTQCIWLFDRYIELVTVASATREENFVDAIIEKNDTIFYDLIEKVDVDSKVYTLGLYGQTVGYSPLIFACIHGNVDIVRKLCNFGYNPNEKTDECMLPIEYAILYKRFEIVMYLLDLTVDKSSAIILIIQTNYLELFDRIMKLSFRNVCVNRMTPLLASCWNNQNEFMTSRIIEEKSKEININETDGMGYSALHICVLLEKFKTIKLLCENTNININHKDFEGNTALSLAKFYGLKDIEEYLIFVGANCELRLIEN